MNKSFLTEEDRQFHYDKFYNLMDHLGLDAAFVCGEGAVKYLAGEFMSAWGAHAFIPRQGSPTMFVAHPGREYVLTPIRKNINDYWIDNFQVNSFEQLKIATAASDNKMKVIGVTFGFLSFSMFEMLKRLMPEAKFVDITKDFQLLRQQKGRNYIGLAHQAMSIVDLCVADLENELRVGMTEYEVCALLQKRMLYCGAEGSLILVNSDTRDISSPSMPFDHRPKILEKGDHLVAEVTVNFRGCWLQKIVICSFGRPDPDILSLYNAVDQAIAAAIPDMKPGWNARDTINGIDDYIEAKGFLSPRQNYTSGPQGHLSGFEMDEGGFSPFQDFILEEGMLFVLHPGAAIHGWHPGEKGIFGPGTMYLVQADGCLTMSPRPNKFLVVDS